MLTTWPWIPAGYRDRLIETYTSCYQLCVLILEWRCCPSGSGTARRCIRRLSLLQIQLEPTAFQSQLELKDRKQTNLELVYDNETKFISSVIKSVYITCVAIVFDVHCTRFSAVVTPFERSERCFHQVGCVYVYRRLTLPSTRIEQEGPFVGIRHAHVRPRRSSVPSTSVPAWWLRRSRSCRRLHDIGYEQMRYYWNS